MGSGTRGSRQQDSNNPGIAPQVTIGPFERESDMRKGGVERDPAFCCLFALVCFALGGDGEHALHAHIHIQLTGLKAG